MTVIMFPKGHEDEAFELLREVVLLAKAGRDYKKSLARLKQILPKAPSVQVAIQGFFATKH